MRKRINVRHLIGRRAYTMLEIARKLEIHPQTVRGWKEAGMVPIDPGSRHYLFYGASVRKFYLDRHAKKQAKLATGKFYCFRCRCGVEGMRVKHIDQGTKIGSGQRSIRMEGSCAKCGAKVCRFAIGTTKIFVGGKGINIDLQPSLFHSLGSGKE